MDNSDHDGQIPISLQTLPQRLRCPRKDGGENTIESIRLTFIQITFVIKRFEAIIQSNVFSSWFHLYHICTWLSFTCILIIITFIYFSVRLLNLAVIIVCLVSLILCCRALSRAQKLGEETKQMLNVRFNIQLTFSEMWQFLNLW